MNLEFFGIDFEIEYMLFIDEPVEEAGIYIIHTDKAILDVGATTDLHEAIETNPNVKNWLARAGKDDIYIAFQKDKDPESRQDKLNFLQDKIVAAKEQ